MSGICLVQIWYRSLDSLTNYYVIVNIHNNII